MLGALRWSGPVCVPEQARALRLWTWLLAEQENLWAAAAQTADIPDAPADLLARLIGLVASRVDPTS